MWNGTMFVDLDWPLNASSLLSASAELLVNQSNRVRTIVGTNYQSTMKLEWVNRSTASSNCFIHHWIQYTAICNRVDNGSVGYGSNGSTNLGGSRGSRVSTHNPKSNNNIHNFIIVIILLCMIDGLIISPTFSEQKYRYRFDFKKAKSGERA